MTRRRAGSRAAPPPPVRGRRRGWCRDERGAYASFIAVIATALLIFGGVAYDAPRLTAARGDALHAAHEAARVAAATVAAGGTVDDAAAAVDSRLALSRIYGESVTRTSLDCVGSRVRVTVESRYLYRSTLRAFRARQPIAAGAAAEAYLVLPDGSPSELHYLGECPL